MIDLHVHSTASDGSYTPAGLAELAKETGVEAFALTDHDTIDGVAEAAEAASRLGVGFINGMEVTMAYKQRKLHVICLGFDAQHPEFIRLYQEIRFLKEESMLDVIEALQRKGVEIDAAKVQRYAVGRMDRYAIMRCMADMKIFGPLRPIWDNYLNPALKEVGVDTDIPAEKALAAIKAAGGVSSLAHFHKQIGLKGMSRFAQENALQELMSYGLSGMEKFYPNYTLEDQAFAVAMIDKYKMLPTAGTDFHGANRPGVMLGSGIENNLSIPLQIIEDIWHKCRIIQ